MTYPMKSIRLLALLPLFTLLFSCEKRTELPGHVHDDMDVCGGVLEPCEPVIIDARQYFSAPEDDFEFINVELSGHNLWIEIGFGGGCGPDPELKLIAEDGDCHDINLKLSLSDEDPCEAYLTQSFCFDLTPFGTCDGEPIRLNLKGYETIIYQP